MLELIHTAAGLMMENRCMTHAQVDELYPPPQRTFCGFWHRLNELIMGRMAMNESEEHPHNANALLVKDLLEAFHRDADARAVSAADPYKTPKVLLPLAGLIITALVNAGIMWAKVAALEGKMSQVDNVSVLATQVVNLQGENQQIRTSLQRLEDKLEKLYELQTQIQRAIR